MDDSRNDRALHGEGSRETTTCSPGARAPSSALVLRQERGGEGVGEGERQPATGCVFIAQLDERFFSVLTFVLPLIKAPIVQIISDLMICASQSFKDPVKQPDSPILFRCVLVRVLPLAIWRPVLIWRNRNGGIIDTSILNLAYVIGYIIS